MNNDGESKNQEKKDADPISFHGDKKTTAGKYMFIHCASLEARFTMPKRSSCRPTNSIFIVYENRNIVTDRHAIFNTNILRVIRVSEAGTTHVFAVISKSP